MPPEAALVLEFPRRRCKTQDIGYRIAIRAESGSKARRFFAGVSPRYRITLRMRACARRFGVLYAFVCFREARGKRAHVDAILRLGLLRHSSRPRGATQWGSCLCAIAHAGNLARKLGGKALPSQ